jgi:hypothetical protein
MTRLVNGGKAVSLRLSEDQEPPRAPRHTWSRTVHHGGRNYVATEDMAAIFEAKANDAIARGETGLVPLLHRGGVDLLLIAPETRFTVVNIELGVTGGRIAHRRPLKPEPFRPAS